MAKTKKESKETEDDEEKLIKADDEDKIEDDDESEARGNANGEDTEKSDDESEEDLKKEDKEDDEDTEKAEGNPEEENADAKTDGHTVTTAPLINQTPGQFVPQSGIAGKRTASVGSMVGGQSPSAVSYGKSAEADLLKSPLYMNLSKQLAGFEKAMQVKVDAMVKSFEARFDNLNKALTALENMPIRKAFSEDITGTSNPVEAATFEKKIETGRVRFH